MKIRTCTCVLYSVYVKSGVLLEAIRRSLRFAYPARSVWKINIFIVIDVGTRYLMCIKSLVDIFFATLRLVLNGGTFVERLITVI